MAFSDIHTHLLFGVDDGADDEDEMHAIADAAYKSGTRLICCTPHFHPGYFGNNRDRSAASFERFAAYAEETYPDMTVYLGNEIRYDPECVSWLSDGACRTLNKTRYVLVDFSEVAEGKLIENGLNRLLNAGYIPVLAHAERYRALHGKLSTIYSYRDRGVVIQADTQSLFGGFGFAIRRQCRKLLAEGLIDIFSSDAHDCTSRPPEMDECYNFILKKYGSDRADALCRENAAKLMLGEPIRKDFS